MACRARRSPKAYGGIFEEWSVNKSLSEMIEEIKPVIMALHETKHRDGVLRSDYDKLKQVATILARAVEYNCRVESQLEAAFENYKSVSADAIAKAKEILGDTKDE